MPAPPDTERVRRRPTTELWLVVALAVAGVAIGLFVTRHGVAITDDSQTYIGAARNLADGKGITVPFTNVLDGFSPRQAADFGGKVPLLLFPPLFSVVLAPFERLGIDSVDALRFLNPLLLGASLALLGSLGYRMTRSVPVAVAGAALALHAYLLQLFGFVQSEPFYLVLSLLGLLLLATSVRSGRTSQLVVFGVVAALACLTRVVGVSLVATGVIAVVAWSAGPIRTRMARASVLGVASLLPLVVFLVQGSVAAGEGRRPIAWHPVSRADLRDALTTLDRWLVPLDPFGVMRSGTRTAVGLLVGALVVVIVVLAVTARPARPTRPAGPVRPDDREPAPAEAEERTNPRILPILAVYVGCYAAVLVVARTLTDASIAFQFGGRLLVPALPVAWLVALGVVARWAHARLPALTATRVVTGVAVAAMVLAALQVSRGSEQIFGWPDGPGVNPPVAASPTLQLLRRYPRSTFVATNDPGRAWYDDGFDAVNVPAARIALSNRRNPHLARDIAELRSLLAERHGLVVYVDGPYLTTLHLMGEDQLKAALPLREIAHTADGRVYELAGK
jgi:hypothetical protein